ncbi:MAG: hypothetical protein CMM49_03355 [Rhodospirillaceae bacterium]|nr:hypothetical protein [Rhodospirillaceae bacterium]
MNSSINKLLKKSEYLNNNALVKNLRSYPTLWFFTDNSRNPDPYTILNQLPKNSGIVFRDYFIQKRNYKAAKMAEFCRKKQLILIIGGDAKLALQVGAAGVHIPEFNKQILPYLKSKNSNWIISTSVHDRRSYRKVQTLGANIIFLSPVFNTSSHPDKRPLGKLYISRLVREFGVFSIALGGINSKTACSLTGTGVNGIAAISGFVIN